MIKPRRINLSLIIFLLSCLAACQGAAQPETQAALPEAQQAAVEGQQAAGAAQADLAGIKTYLLEQAGELKVSAARLKEAGNQYYNLARASNFDYAALWQDKPDEVVKVIKEARAAWLAARLAEAAPETQRRIEAGFAAAEKAVTAQDGLALAMARAQIWTGLLAGSYRVIETSLQNGKGQTAREWLPLREFRPATRFSRPNADATLAVKGTIQGQVTPADALLAVRADLLDTYQARLNEALSDLENAARNGFAVRRAEHAALAEGYFVILSAAYQEQRGAAALAEARQLFAELRTVAYTGQDLSLTLASLEAALHNFRAAPLSPKEQAGRAGQLLRYLSLVPVEYGRGVSGGR